ncbi:MAG: glycosyltransferase family 39 protein [Anaerolineales bacterium]
MEIKKIFRPSPIGILVLILLIGSALRIYGLDHQSLWNDELESWRQSNFETLNDVILLGVQPDTHPPLFQSALFFVEKYLGETEALLRLPSALSGILSILAIYWLAKRLYSYREGLAAAFMMAVLWCPIFYSQEARNYSFLILFSILSSFFWVEFFIVRNNSKKESSLSTLLGYILTSLALIYTHYFGVILLTLQGIGAYILRLKDLKKLLQNTKIYLLIGLGYLPWIPSALEQFTHMGKISWIDKPAITVFPAYISFILNRSHALAIIALLLLTFLLVKIFYDFLNMKDRSLASLLSSPDFILGYWLVIPVMLTAIISVMWKPIYTQRNLLISLPAAYILLSRAFFQLPFHRFVKRTLIVFFGCSALFQMIFIQQYYVFPHKEQFRDAAYHVLESKHELQAPMIIGQVAFPDYLDYYFQRRGVSFRVNLVINRETDIRDCIDTVKSKNPGAIWYVAAHYKPDEEFFKYLEDNYFITEHIPLLGAEVWLFTRDRTN